MDSGPDERIPFTGQGIEGGEDTCASSPSGREDGREPPGDGASPSPQRTRCLQHGTSPQSMQKPVQRFVQAGSVERT